MFNGAEVKRLRIELGWSQRVLAQKSGLGSGHVSDIENGKSDPTSSTIVRLATALGIPVAALFDTQNGPGIHDTTPSHGKTVETGAAEDGV